MIWVLGFVVFFFFFFLVLLISGWCFYKGLHFFFFFDKWCLKVSLPNAPCSFFKGKTIIEKKEGRERESEREDAPKPFVIIIIGL